MTKTQKEKWLERLFGIVSAIIISISIYSFTSKKDDDKALVNKVIELDKTKANIEYVDKKCFETKEQTDIQIKDIKVSLDEIKNAQKTQSEDTKEILRYLRK